jgi:lipoprotein-releasing system permease protein
LKSYVPFLSLRYLRYHKVSTGLGILGVMLGVGLIIVVVGVMDGFQKRLKDSLIGNSAAVVVKPRYDVDAEALCRELKKVPGVVEASPVVYAMTLMGPDGGGNRENLPCRVMGIDAAREKLVSGLGAETGANHADSKLRLMESATPDNPFRAPPEVRAQDIRLRKEKQGLVLGRGLYIRLHVRLGDRVRIWTGNMKTDAGGNTTREIVSDSELFTSDDYDVDQMLVFMDRRDAQSYFRDWLPQEVDEVRLLLADPERCTEVAKAIHGSMEAIVVASLRKGGRVFDPPLEADTWRDLNRKLLAAVENERGLLLVITSFSFVVVAFLIGSTQSMLVVEKTREIGVLRSLGASVAGTSSVFIGNGLFIGVFGAGAGWGLGIVVTSHIQEIADFIRLHFGRDLFPADIYRFAQIPIDVKSGFVLSVCLGAVGFALLGAILPALRAALLDPVESLHSE